MTTLERFSRRVATPIAAETSADGRSVTVRLVPWDRPTTVGRNDRRGTFVETFRRGGLVVPDDAVVLVEREHGGPLVGVLTDHEERADGLYGTIRMSRSADGTNTLEDIHAGIFGAVSVDFYDAPVPPGAERVERSGAQLYRVAFVTEPALDAPILSVRSRTDVPAGALEPEQTSQPATSSQNERSSDEPHPAPAPEQENPSMDENTTTEDVVQEDEVTTHDEPAQREQRSAPARPAQTRQTSAPAPQFPTFGHFARAAALGEISGEPLQRYYRALADVVTGDVTGMIREQWISEVVDLMATFTPTLNAWRSRPLPASGMSISQPVVTTRPTVGEQETQKSDITSTDAVIGVAQWDIQTFAGGNDVSLQALTRAEPDLLNELMRLYAQQLAHAINGAAAASLTAAAAVGVSGNTALEYVDPKGFPGLVVDASALFMSTTALRRPANVIGMSVDLWKALGKALDADDRPLFPSLNPMNASGTFGATTVEGNLAGVSWYVDPDLGDDGDGIAGVIGVREAFVTARGPVGTLTADVPLKLGRDVAVYQEAAFGAADASGLVQIVDAA